MCDRVEIHSMVSYTSQIFPETERKMGKERNQGRKGKRVSAHQALHLAPGISSGSTARTMGVQKKHPL